MSKQYPFIASRLFGAPLLITEAKLQAILAVLGPRFGIDGLPKPDVAAFENNERRRAGYRVEGNVAIIPVYGTLVSRGDSLDAASGLTGYNRLARAVSMAQADDEVRHILFDYDTPGGEAALIDALGESLFSARGRKPMTSIINEEANSAGLWLASASDEVVITRAGKAGSVGVVMTHMSVEGMAEEMGIKITHIHAGARKVDFSPYFNLSEKAQAIGQERVMELYDLFTQTVARNRGLSVDSVKSTEAAIYTGQKAVDIGFVDRVDSYESTLNRLQQQAKPVFYSTGVKAMTEKTEPVEKKAEDKTVINAEDMAAIAQLCADANVPKMASSLIREGVSLEDAKTRINMAGQIKALCDLAKVSDKSDGYINAGMTIDGVKAALFDIMAARDEALDTQSQVKVSDPNATVEAGWGKAFSKVRSK